MEYTGNIRKMKSSLEDKVQYTLPLYDVLNPGVEVDMNAFIGKEIQLRFHDQINCVVTGKKINKTYGDGMSYDAFMKSPMAVPSIIRPELSRIHEGIALRDKEWEERNHLTPHVTYLSLTSEIKVGVTRQTQIPTRWIDQGAVQAIVLAETPYRQAAGLVEVALKEHVADKTNWRKMLTNTIEDNTPLEEKKYELIEMLPSDLQQWVSDDDEILEIEYPVLQYPEKVKSIKFDKAPLIEKKLLGIKGQYLLFEDDLVMNMRSQTGYKIT
ncbi:MAG: hypothetical protein ACI8U0_002807, partial [Flavobacteriales bacterium]